MGVVNYVGIAMAVQVCFLLPTALHRGGGIVVWVCMMTKKVGHIFKVTEMQVTMMSWRML